MLVDVEVVHLSAALWLLKQSWVLVCSRTVAWKITGEEEADDC